MRVSEIWSAYEKSPMNGKEISARRKQDVAKIWKEFATSYNGDVSEITATSIAEWLEKRCRKCSPKTYDEYLRIIRQVLKATASITGLAINPALEVPIKKKSSISRKPYSQEEVEKVISTVSSGFSVPYHYKIPTRQGMVEKVVDRAYTVPYADEVRLTILLGAYCGMRLGDAVNVDSSQYADGFLTYIPQKTQVSSGVEVVVPVLHAELKEALEKCKGCLTPHLKEWHSRCASDVCRLYRRIFEASGYSTQQECEGRRTASVGGFHALRHSYITWAAERGIPIDVVASCVGHTSTLTTRIYNHVSTARKAREMTRMMSIA